MSEKVRFVGAAEQQRTSFASLCKVFGISPKTGYKWLTRFRRYGVRGLEERSRRPFGNSRAISPEIAGRVLQLRRQFPTWGPKKLVAWLKRNEPNWACPAASTIGDLLKANGLVQDQRPKRSRIAAPSSSTLRQAAAPNVVWSMDFKGWFLVGDRSRCEPYTVTDNFSRFLLCCVAVEDTSTERVWPVLAETFQTYGLPDAVRFDNGVPWSAVRGALQLTAFGARLIRLGIAIERIAPGRPQQNGRHERFHLTLKRDTASPPAATITAQQARFEAFRTVYNDERPHEALGMLPPASKYLPSSRKMPTRLPDAECPPGYDVARVRAGGIIAFRGETYFLTTALVNEPVGLLEVEEGCFEVRFCSALLGHIHSGHPELGLVSERA